MPSEIISRRRRDGTIRLDNTDVPVTGEELAPVLWQGRQWAVTEFGIEARGGSYYVDADRLAEGFVGKTNTTWLAHMADKNWVDVDEFATAWLVALVLHGKGGTVKPEAIRKVLRKLPVEA